MMGDEAAQNDGQLDLFAICAPGLEAVLGAELVALGFQVAQAATGGVAFRADVAGLVRANLWLRSATRVLVRLATFGAPHLAQLDKRSRRLPWPELLAPGRPVRVRATCHRSKIYHSQAAAERVQGAIAAALPSSAAASEDGLADQEVLVRLDRNLCTISLDSSGAPLYQRGLKKEVTGAPLRESLAAGLLLICGYDGGEALLDPMCGAGTFALEAASIACGAAPGAAREFAFSAWPGFDGTLLERARAEAAVARRADPPAPILAGDLAGGAAGVSRRNLDRAGYTGLPVERRDLTAWSAPVARGLFICNPPYGERLGRGEDLGRLYREIGRIHRQRFGGWQLAVLTSQPLLAKALGVAFDSVEGPFHHGGLKVRLYRRRPA